MRRYQAYGSRGVSKFTDDITHEYTLSPPHKKVRTETLQTMESFFSSATSNSGRTCRRHGSNSSSESSSNCIDRVSRSASTGSSSSRSRANSSRSSSISSRKSLSPSSRTSTSRSSSKSSSDRSRANSSRSPSAGSRRSLSRSLSNGSIERDSQSPITRRSRNSSRDYCDDSFKFEIQGPVKQEKLPLLSQKELPSEQEQAILLLEVQPTLRSSELCKSGHDEMLTNFSHIPSSPSSTTENNEPQSNVYITFFLPLTF